MNIDSFGVVDSLYFPKCTEDAYLHLYTQSHFQYCQTVPSRESLLWPLRNSAKGTAPFLNFKLQHACKMFQNVPECMQHACKMFQNVPECMQNVLECSRMFKNGCRKFQKIPECYRMHAECSRMFQNAPECMQKVPENSRMLQNACRMFQNACRMFQNACRMFQKACRCMSLHAGQ